jgi:hypothetical protein
MNMYYRITADGVKIHWATDTDVVYSVLSNLKERFDLEPGKYELSSDLRKKKIFWESGRASYLSEDEPRFSFFLSGGLELVVKAQYWAEFKTQVALFIMDNERSTRLYDGKFYKLHAQLHVLCLSEIQKEDLIKQIAERSEEYDTLAQNLWCNLVSFPEVSRFSEYLLKYDNMASPLN